MQRIKEASDAYGYSHEFPPQQQVQYELSSIGRNADTLLTSAQGGGTDRELEVVPSKVPGSAAASMTAKAATTRRCLCVPERLENTMARRAIAKTQRCKTSILYNQLEQND